MARMGAAIEPHNQQAAPIRVAHISVNYNGVRALDDISAEFLPGERVAIVGPNGAGKTTLFKVIAGALPPSRGSVDIYGHGPAGHICIAYVPQRSQVDLNFPVTVAEVVMMGRIRKIGLFRWPRKADWQFVRQALEKVGMAAFAQRQIGELSGGQQQRVFLARAIAQEARVLLLDEPLSGLDMPSQEAIFRILEDFSRDGATVLVSTHDLNLAGEQFDRVMLLNRRLIAFGPPEQVLHREALLAAYGGGVHVVRDDNGALLLTDTCCGGDHDHA